MFPSPVRSSVPLSHVTASSVQGESTASSHVAPNEDSSKRDRSSSLSPPSSPRVGAMQQQLLNMMPKKQKMDGPNDPEDLSKEKWDEMKGEINPELRQKVDDMFEDSYSTIQMHTSSKDGKQTFLLKDGSERYNIENNATWHVPDNYDYKVSKTWGTGKDGQKFESIDKFNSGRSASSLDAKRLASATEGIENGNLLDPIKVKKNSGGTFDIQDGNHRLQAAQNLGLEKIPYQEV